MTRSCAAPRRRVALALVAVLLVAAGCTATSTTSSSGAVAGAERIPPPEVGGVSLPVAGTGEDFPFVAPDDGLLLVYFGFTHCPDICPTTLADTAIALGDLGEDAARVELAMVTVDPDRDTDAVLEGYVQSFVDDAVALRTDDAAELQMAANAFGASYLIVDGPDGEPEVGHSTSLYAVDDEGTLALTWSFGTPADDIAEDLRVLLDRA